MIKSEIVPLQNDTFLVRFSDPDEKLEKKQFTMAQSQEDYQRRLDFMNRKFITEKLTSWIKQRSKALPDLDTRNLLSWMGPISKASLSNVCEFVTRKRSDFENAAPAMNSPCYPYYKNTIVLILDFCAGVENNSKNNG